jgi:hypothetical protein
MRETTRRHLAAAEDVTGYRRVIHPELSKSGTCGLCVAAADRIYYVDDLMPIHTNCVPPWARIAAHQVSGVTRRRYAGELVVLRTAGGEDFSVTPNHPVLTAEGWVPAGLVREGDHVVRHGRGDGVVGRRPGEDHEPVTAEQVWRAATVEQGLLPRVVPLTSEDFHGDGSNGEVDVVPTLGLLADIGDVTFTQPTGEARLVAGHRAGGGFPTASRLRQSDLVGWRTTGGGIGGTGYLLPLLERRADVPQALGLRTAAALDTLLGETTADHRALDSVLPGQRQLARTIQVLLDDLLNRKAVPTPSRFDPPALEFAAEGRDAYAELGGCLRRRLAGHVTLDRVVHADRVGFRGHVYNLHTAEGWYSSDDFIVSNCKCEPMPIVRGRGDPARIFNGADTTELYRRVLAAAGSTAADKLKNTRIRVSEHGELGPVLHDAGHRFRDAGDVESDLRPESVA